MFRRTCSSCAILASLSSAVVQGQESLPSLVKQVQRSVVTVFAFGSGTETQGTGFFIQQNVIVTNSHVIASGTRYFAKTSDGKVLGIDTVVANDSFKDLAVLRVDGSGPPLPLSSSTPQVGRRVFVVGSPLGLAQTVTDGIVSAVRDKGTSGEVLQITAAISHGSSGSPVKDSNGMVVGVATFKLGEGESLNFAVPATSISTLIARSPRSATSVAGAP